MSISLGDVGWQAHPEVWVLLAGVIALALYVVRVVEPKAVAAGYPPIGRMNRIWFGLGAAGLWLASDWPVHDVAEEYLYFVHMAQHLLISMLLPAMFILATPRWVFEILLPDGSAARRFVAVGSRPLVAGVVFNALTVLLHWPVVVQASFESGAVHFALHVMVFAAGLLMWMPVIGPVPEWRLHPIGQCIYLFLMSVVPTVPSGWLIFAEEAVYRHYDTVERLWGIDVLTDQQAAGVIMKLVGGFFLWAVIVTIFARWATAEQDRDRAARRARHRATADAGAGSADGATVDLDDEPLTFEDVADTFARTAAPVEGDHPRPT